MILLYALSNFSSFEALGKKDCGKTQMNRQIFIFS
jgi:hypothetical protein